MHKIERLMGIILALNKSKKITANELARKFEVDIRTIYRDIQALGELNIPIISEPGRDGGYWLQDGYFIPPITFNKNELFSLLLSKKVIEEIGIPGYSEYMKLGFLKLESVVSNELISDFQKIESRIKFNRKDKAVSSKEFEFFNVIKNALENNMKVKINYFLSESLETTEIIIRPYGLIYIDNTWCVVSFCENDECLKSLGINFIKYVELMEETFSLPIDFNIDDYYCNNHCIVKCKNELYENVKLRVKKSSYYDIKDYIFFNDGEIVEEDTLNYILNVKASQPEGYSKLAFRFYDSVEILEPLWLREKIFKEFKKMHEKYQHSSQ